MCIAISENTMWGYWWVKERIKSMRLKTSGFLEKQGICTWKIEQMEDKPQIFQFTLLCIILFCSTNWRFMKGHIIIWYDMIWYDSYEYRICPWWYSPASGLDTMVVFCESLIWLTLVQFFRFVDVDIWWVGGSCRGHGSSPARVYHLGFPSVSAGVHSWFYHTA